MRFETQEAYHRFFRSKFSLPRSAPITINEDPLTTSHKWAGGSVISVHTDRQCKVKGCMEISHFAHIATKRRFDGKRDNRARTNRARDEDEGSTQV